MLYFLAYVPMYTLAPRFILSLRAVYARDVQGRRGEGIDTGFGLLSTSTGRSGTIGAGMVFAEVELNGMGTGTGLSSSSESSGYGAVVPAMVFGDVEPNEGVKNVKAVPGDGATWLA